LEVNIATQDTIFPYFCSDGKFNFNNMRIDKFLWALRYFKTRSIATEAVKKDKAKINNLVAKPSKEIFAGDHIIVRIDQVDYELEVLGIPESRVSAKLVDQFRKDVTPAEALAHKKQVEAAQKHYRQKGLGRPTKKERRSLESYKDEGE
jgi:ribosome-associated heat shock protein Hsp15